MHYRGTFHDGMLNGTVVEIDPQDSSVREVQYKDGAPFGTYRHRRMDGQLLGYGKLLGDVKVEVSTTPCSVPDTPPCSGRAPAGGGRGRELLLPGLRGAARRQAGGRGGVPLPLPPHRHHGPLGGRQAGPGAVPHPGGRLATCRQGGKAEHLDLYLDSCSVHDAGRGSLS